MEQVIKVGFSPCPNDTFMFDALIHNRIDTGDLRFEAVMADVEELNQMAMNAELEMTKLSYHAFAHVTDKYQMLPSGSALGRGVGPLLISSKPMTLEDAANSVIAIPGELTSAVFLLNMFLPTKGNYRTMLFSDIENAVLKGEVAAGLIIHENRFTYASRGLYKIADMGELWEKETNLPVPLGGIAVNRNLSTELKMEISKLLKKSIQFAYEHPEYSLPFIQEHAQEMDPEIQKKHIELYVNNFSIDLGDEGRKAVNKFLEIAKKNNIITQHIHDAVLS